MNQIPTATLLVSYTHGDEQERSAFDTLAQTLSQQLDQPVVACSLDYPERTIWHAITGLLGQGMVKIVIIPLFLSPSEVQENVISDAVAFANGRWSHAHFHISPLPSWDEWLQLLKTNLRGFQNLAGFKQEETAVVLVGQGTPNAHINSDLAKQAQLLDENGRFAGVDIAFVKESSPTVGELISQYQTLGVRQIVVVPWLLFPGELVANLATQIEIAEQQTDVAIRMAPPLAEQNELTTILANHYQAALDDRSLLPVSWKALQWQITAEVEAEHKQRPGQAPADEATFQKLIGKIDDMLPPRYRGQVSPGTNDVASNIELIVAEDDSVQWAQMFGLAGANMGDLALAGGHASRGELLEALNPDDCLANEDKYTAVLHQIGQGIQAITGLETVPSKAAGWIGVQCDSEEMAIWLVRAIIVENVMVRREGNVIFLPAGPHYRMQDEIPGIVAVLAKTWRFWIEHITAKQWQEAKSSDPLSMAGRQQEGPTQ